jgi:tetratricopeptide (TPR) repeat protein
LRNAKPLCAGPDEYFSRTGLVYGTTMKRNGCLLAIALVLAAAAPAAPERREALTQASAALDAGRPEEAERLAAPLLQANPSDELALLLSGLAHARNGKLPLALQEAQRLTGLYPGSIGGWELMIQVAQAAGDMNRREDAIREVRSARNSAMNPKMRNRTAFVRDRIVAGNRVLLVAELFDGGGGNTTRFEMTEEGAGARHRLAVWSDEATTETWRENGLLPEGRVLYHLDAIHLDEDGNVARFVYEYYIDTLDYDAIRAKAAAILTGAIKPMSGQEDTYWTSARH